MNRGAGSASIAASIAAKLKKKKKALAELVAPPPGAAPTGVPGTGPRSALGDAEGVRDARVPESQELWSTSAAKSSNPGVLSGTREPGGATRSRLERAADGAGTRVVIESVGTAGADVGAFSPVELGVLEPEGTAAGCEGIERARTAFDPAVVIGGDEPWPGVRARGVSVEIACVTGAAAWPRAFVTGVSF
jgi:hypothetical protein